jgi:hypothetical protein
MSVELAMGSRAVGCVLIAIKTLCVYPGMAMLNKSPMKRPLLLANYWSTVLAAAACCWQMALRPYLDRPAAAEVAGAAQWNPSHPGRKAGAARWQYGML